MKKGLILSILAVLAVSAFAAGPDSYVVKSVTGKVQYEAAPGNWKNLTAGQKISASTVVNTSLNSTLVVTAGSSDVTIKAMQKGTVASLTSGNVAAGGIKKSNGLNKTAVAAESTRSDKGVATASSRASEAKEDVDWDE